ncbi:divalent metal cation transporter [Pseudomonas sp. 10S4]|nr:divalent metal cation transporter [Pseudomonas sp. 10S4]WPX16408.1 divalent metal cation transporter [Pseudomonas sp. 10S4]
MNNKELIDKPPVVAHRSWIRKLGPGLITGAADDDPSGIATYSQAGAQFGLNTLWTLFFTFPLMVGIQIISAKIGRVSGHGLATNIRKHYPRPFLYSIVALLMFANTVNIAADIAAMGAALKLLIGGSPHFYAVGFGVVSLLLQVFIPYKRYVRVLKWLTLVLLAYVGIMFAVHIPWAEVIHRTLWPRMSWKPEYIIMVVAIFGTTISPYLFSGKPHRKLKTWRLTPRLSR